MSKHISWRALLAISDGQIKNLHPLTEETRKEFGALSYEGFVTDDDQFVYVHERCADPPVTPAVAHLQEFPQKFGGRFSRMVERTEFTVYGNPSDEPRGSLDDFGATT